MKTRTKEQIEDLIATSIKFEVIKAKLRFLLELPAGYTVVELPRPDAAIGRDIIHAVIDDESEYEPPANAAVWRKVGGKNYMHETHIEIHRKGYQQILQIARMIAQYHGDARDSRISHAMTQTA